MGIALLCLTLILKTMKTITINKLLFLFLSVLLFACSSDDNSVKEKTLTGFGNVSIDFDNGVAGDALLLDVGTYTNSMKETLKISRLNYIVSNFVLIDAEGKEFVYPKNHSYFLINEKEKKTEITLKDVPAGKYVAMRFGIGVDQEKYLEGADGQGKILEEAERNHMMWSWLTGYIFINFEGTFTSAQVTEEKPFKIHMGSHGSKLDNYKEVTVGFNGSQALVGEKMNPLIHFEVDANMILDGTYKLSLTEKPIIMVDANLAPKVAENATAMFKVDHIHNGSGGHH